MQLLKDMSVGAFLRDIVLVKKRKYFYLRPVIDYERLTGIRLLGISLACQLALFIPCTSIFHLGEGRLNSSN